MCAATVDRGVLLRPLGDVVVLMPPLSITADEIDRIVDALAGAIDEAAREGVCAVTAWQRWIARRARTRPRRRTVALTADVRRGAARAGMIDGREFVSFASNDYFGLTGHPAVIAAAMRRPNTVHGSGSARV